MRWSNCLFWSCAVRVACRRRGLAATALWAWGVKGPGTHHLVRIGRHVVAFEDSTSWWFPLPPPLFRGRMRWGDPDGGGRPLREHRSWLSWIPVALIVVFYVGLVLVGADWALERWVLSVDWSPAPPFWRPPPPF